MPVDRSLASPVDRHPIFPLTQPADQLTHPPHQFLEAFSKTISVDESTRPNLPASN